MKIHLNRAGQSLGQFTPDEVRAGWQEGKFNASDLAWRDGMASWRPLGEVIDELAPGTPGGEAPALPVGNGPAWEQRAEAGLVPALIETVRAVLLDPSKTFATMRLTGGLGAPLFFFVLVSTLGGLAGVIYNVVLQSMGATGQGKDEMAAAVFGSAIGVGIVIMLLPIVFAATAFVSAGLVHLALMLIGGANRPFEATFRVACYSGGATAVFQFLPLCGALVSSIYNLILMILGISKVHGITTLRAAIAVLLPTVVCCGFFAALIAGGVALGLTQLSP